MGAWPRRFLIASVLATASLASGGAVADALAYEDILGKWCGTRTNPNWVNLMISRDELVITHLPNKTKNVLKIDHFEFGDTAVTLHYFAAGALNGVAGSNLFQVSYGEFGADGKTMVQLHNSVQPRDAYYKRC